MPEDAQPSRRDPQRAPRRGTAGTSWIQRLPPGLRRRVPENVRRRVLQLLRGELSAPTGPTPRVVRDSGARMMKVAGGSVASLAVATPRMTDVQRDNVTCVLDLFERHGIEHFLVASSHARPWAVAVPATDRPALVEGLQELGRTAPVSLQLQFPSGTRRRALAARCSRRELRHAVRIGVFQAVDDPVTGLVIGPRAACFIDVWDEDETGGLDAPVPNGRVAAVSAADRASRATVTVDGNQYETLATLPPEPPFEVDFPIDVVYMWVDDEDPAWRARRDRRLEAVGRPSPAASAAHHYRNHDELRYSLRSLDRYAPWVRHVYLLTDQQRPDWLADVPDLTVVDHRDVFPSDALPSFNSHAISARTHHIDGLSDRFLLLNDDVLLGRPVVPEDFFHPNGIAKFFLSTSTLPSGPLAAGDPAHIAARKRVRDLVHERYGIVPTQTFQHTPVPLLRPWLLELEEEFPEEYTRTVRSPFRSSEDIVISWLHHYSAYARGLAVPGDIDYSYFGLGSIRAYRRLASLLGQRQVDCLCLNDVPGDDIPDAVRIGLLETFLDAFLPVPSRFERADATPTRDREEVAARFHDRVAQARQQLRRKPPGATR